MCDRCGALGERRAEIMNVLTSGYLMEKGQNDISLASF